MKKNNIGYVIGGIFSGLSVILGIFLSSFIIFLVCIIIAAVSMILNQKYNEAILAKEYLENEEKENNKYIKSCEIEKKNDLENVELNVKFKEKYGISFLSFREKMISSECLYLKANKNSTTQHKFQIVELNNAEYFVLNLGLSIYEKLIFSSLWDENLVNIYKNAKIEDVSELLYNYDLLEYVEFVEKNLECPITRGPSALDLAIHEELYGTASAINKANTPIPTEKINISYITFNFASKLNIMPLMYEVGGLKKENYFGILKKVWLTKEKNRLINSKLINNNDTNTYAKLRELKSLLDEGIITQEEFEREKNKILN